MCNKKLCVTSIFILFIFGFSAATSVETNANDILRIDIQQEEADQLLDTIPHSLDSAGAYIALCEKYIQLGDEINLGDAEKVLWEGLRHFPEDFRLLKKFAELNHLIGRYTDAMSWLERALNIDNSDRDDMEQLIDYYIHERMKDKVEYARNFMRESLNKNPDDIFYYKIVSRLEIELGEPVKAIVTLKKAIELEPDNASLHRLLSEAYYWYKQGITCTDEYFRWLELEKDKETLETEYALTKLTMTAEDTLIFANVPFEEKSNFLLKYWRINDTYPITVQNERLLEFLRRISYARTFYPSYKNPLRFDERGNSIIRWGIYVQNEELDTKESRTNEVVGGRTYHYSEEGGVDPRLQYLPMAKYDEPTYRFFSGLYPRRIYGENNFFDRPPVYGMALRVFELPFESHITQFKGEGGKTRIEISYGVSLENEKPFFPGDSSSFLYETSFIVFDSSATRHLNAHRSDRFGVPPYQDYSKVQYASEEKYQVSPGNYMMAFQMMQILDKNVESFDSRIKLQTNPSRSMGRYPPIPRNLKPRASKLNRYVFDKKASFVVQPLRVKNYAGTHLMMSDLKFCRDARFSEVDEETGLDRIRTTPYPYSYAHRRQPVFLYFEVYNLMIEPFRGNHYTVTLNLEREMKEGGFVSQIMKPFSRLFSGGESRTVEMVYEATRMSQMAIECLKLDLSNVKPGKLRLTVTVKDANIGKEVENSMEFELRK